jgi:hypothetical protein
MKYKKLSTITKKIDEAEKHPGFNISYEIEDSSVQAELRLSAHMTIRLAVDHIHYPKNMAGDGSPLWNEMALITEKISGFEKIYNKSETHCVKISSRTKTGPSIRDAERKTFKIRMGNVFLTAFRDAEKQIKNRRKQIKNIQKDQKQLIKKLRAHNSAHLAKRKAEKEEIARKNTEAITSGKFWNANKEALKDYFNPPFDKNFLADVSERWRAALFLECRSVSYKNFNGNRGYKLEGTGRGWLCGIDDNGDEWGHPVDEICGSIDDFGNMGLDCTVDGAMSKLFGIGILKLTDCQRQGDLLFCPTEIPIERREWCRWCGHKRDEHIVCTDADADLGATYEYLACPTMPNFQYDATVRKPVELYSQDEPWEIRESHTVESDGLMRNGQYFKSENEIKITHTSHAPVILQPGEYRLYELQIEDAD